MTSEEVNDLMTLYGAYAIDTAAELHAELLALFIHHPTAAMRFAFFVVQSEVLVTFPTEEGLQIGLTAIEDAESLEDQTDALTELLPDDATLDGHNMPAFIGQPLKEIARLQELDEAALYISSGVTPDSVHMAWKIEGEQLLCGAGAGVFWAAFAQAAAEGELSAVAITDGVRARMGDDFPEWEEAPQTSVSQHDLLKALAPRDFEGDPWAPAEGGGSVILGAGGPDERTVELTAGAKQAFEAMRRTFVKKFGREPGEGDPLMFDPDAPGPEPVPLPQEKIDAMYALMGGEQGQLDREAILEERGMVHRTGPKPGRNDPCPCGSGLKFKKCHGR
jgi:hypothetical protein